MSTKSFVFEYQEGEITTPSRSFSLCVCLWRHHATLDYTFVPTLAVRIGINKHEKQKVNALACPPYSPFALSPSLVSLFFSMLIITASSGVCVFFFLNPFPFLFNKKMFLWRWRLLDCFSPAQLHSPFLFLPLFPAWCLLYFIFTRSRSHNLYLFFWNRKREIYVEEYKELQLTLEATNNHHIHLNIQIYIPSAEACETEGSLQN